MFAWRLVFDGGAYGYYENLVTGERRTVRRLTGGHSPLDLDWLARRPYRVPTPPTGGSGVQPAK